MSLQQKLMFQLHFFTTNTELIAEPQSSSPVKATNTGGAEPC